MSANIPIGKLKFSVFGRGYDDERGNSGTGTVNEEIDMRVGSAVIDSTGAYVWATISWEDEYHVLRTKFVKLSTTNWQEVEQTTIPDDCLNIYHPSNVSNNYGLAIRNSDPSSSTAYIFDLTNDTVIATISVTRSVSGETKDDDCIYANNKIYLSDRQSGRSNTTLQVFDIANETYNESTIIGGAGFIGFINSSLAYSCYLREWFYQTSMAYGVDFSGNVVWADAGVNDYNNIGSIGFTANGKIYLPVKIDDKWYIGEFNGTSSPSLPTPIRTFGTFDTAPNFLPHAAHNDRNIYIIYNDGRTKACAVTSDGIMLTDFTNIDYITDQILKPLAMNDDMVLCAGYDDSKLYVFGI